MNKKLMRLTGLLGLTLLLAGCRGAALGQEENRGEPPPQSVDPTAETRPADALVESEQSSPPPRAALPEAAVESAPNSVTNTQPDFIPQEIPPFDHKLAEGEYHWNQLLPRDGIRPIYEDELQFAPADEAPYSDDELVIGVEINGEARAYAIGPLNSREMVNDTVGGVPILVTW